MGSHNITCHPTQANIPTLTPASKAGARFTYPGGMEGWVDLGDLIAPRPGVEPATAWSKVRRPNRSAIRTRETSRGIAEFWQLSSNFTGVSRTMGPGHSLAKNNNLCQEAAGSKFSTIFLANFENSELLIKPLYYQLQKSFHNLYKVFFTFRQVFLLYVWRTPIIFTPSLLR